LLDTHFSASLTDRQFECLKLVNAAHKKGKKKLTLQKEITEKRVKKKECIFLLVKVMAKRLRHPL